MGEVTPAVPLVYEAWANVLAGVSHVPKSSAEGMRGEFRSIDALLNALHPQLAKWRVTLNPRASLLVGESPLVFDGKASRALFWMHVDVVAVDGSTLTLGPCLASATDFNNRAIIQAQQGCFKLILIQALCIPVNEPSVEWVMGEQQLECLVSAFGQSSVEFQEATVLEQVIGFARQSEANYVAALARVQDNAA